MSEATKPLPSIAEEYRIASHYWQQKWSEMEKQISAMEAQNRKAKAVVTAARELCTAYEILSVGGANEDDYFRCGQASNDLRTALRQMDA